MNNGKIPPQDIEMEQGILGAILIEKNAILEVVNILTPEAFYKESNKIIYLAIVELFEANQPIELLSVTHKLRKLSKLEEVGGAYYITEIMNNVSSSANIVFWAFKIKEFYVQRLLITLSVELANKANEDTTDVYALIEETQNKLFDLIQDGSKRGPEKVDKILQKTITQIEINSHTDNDAMGTPSGLPSIDGIIGSFGNSDLVIIAARPAMGKTALGLTLARNAASIYKKKVLFFSIEMSAVQLVMRLISSEAEVEGHKLKQGDVEPHEWQLIFDKASGMENLELYIDDTPGLTISDLKSKVRRMHQTIGVDQIVVDYLQIIGTRNGFKGTREQEVTLISRGLKGIAKELNIPVIALAQVGRAAEQRSNKRPMLSDLRESSSLEAEADVVMFIHRPEYYNEIVDENGNSTLGKAEIIIAKHRHGDVGTVMLEYKNKYVKFVECDSDIDLFHQTDTSPKIINNSGEQGDVPF